MKLSWFIALNSLYLISQNCLIFNLTWKLRIFQVLGQTLPYNCYLTEIWLFFWQEHWKFHLILSNETGWNWFKIFEFSFGICRFCLLVPILGNAFLQKLLQKIQNCKAYFIESDIWFLFVYSSLLLYKIFLDKHLIGWLLNSAFDEYSILSSPK